MLRNGASGKFKMVASAHHRTRLISILSAGVATVGAASLQLGSASAETIAPFPAQAPMQDPEDARVIRAKTATPLSRCLATWNNTSGMSKRKWAQTCKRVVKQNPGLYSKPF
jgi:hypothetical protein